MAQKKTNLLVVAHPDDEAIFFAGLVLRQKKSNWRLICVTNGNSDGRGGQRWLELQQSCRRLGIRSVEQWDFEDKYEQRLNVDQLKMRLLDGPKPAVVYTHSALGEYGHPHHQDVSLAVHRAFHKICPVWSVAYNCRPKKMISLNEKEFAVKCEILRKIYGLETQRFLHLLPCSAFEGFVQSEKSEVEAVHRALREGTPLTYKGSPHWSWLSPVQETIYFQLKRPF